MADRRWSSATRWGHATQWSSERAFLSLSQGVVAVDFTPFIAADIFDALDARVATGERSFSNTEDLRSYLTRRYPRLPSDAIERRMVNGYAPAGDGTLRPLARGDAVTATCAGLREDLAPYVLSLKTPALFVRGIESPFVTSGRLGGDEVPPARPVDLKRRAAPTTTCPRSGRTCWPSS